MTAAARTLEVLDADECRALLRSRTVGRVCVNRRGTGPLVVPVAYVVDQTGSVVFRTSVGTRLSRLVRGPVSFQVDELDDESRTGWSVLVEGFAHPVEPDDPAAASVERWAPGPLTHGIRIARSSISGRRLR